MRGLLVNFFFLLSFCFVNAQTIPFNVDKRPMPAGKDFSVILPMKVADYKRTDFAPPGPDTDGEATFSNGKEEIFMLFSLAATAADRKETMKTIYEEVKNNPTTEKPIILLKADPSCLQYIGKKIAFFAWTRGNYCFSADVKSASSKALKDFIQAFPY